MNNVINTFTSLTICPDDTQSINHRGFMISYSPALISAFTFTVERAASTCVVDGLTFCTVEPKEIMCRSDGRNRQALH